MKSLDTWPRSLSDRYPHGTRAKYSLERCRCFQCKVANSNYEYGRICGKREGTWQPYATSEQIRAVLSHVERLRATGIGVRQIAHAAGVKRGTLREFLVPERRSLRGRPVRRRIRTRTAERILAVSLRDRAGGSYIPAAKTWCLIDTLRSAGYPKRRLAVMLGYASPALQFRRHRVLVRTARRVARLFRELWLKDTRVRAAAGELAPADWRLAVAMS